MFTRSSAPLVALSRPLRSSRARPARWLTALVVAMAGLAPRPADAGRAIPGNAQVPSFRAAKSLLTVLYAERPCTLYSDCRFTADHMVDYHHCAYVPRRIDGRANRIEWEHIVPAEAFGHGIAAWRDGHVACVDQHGPFRGRRCAAKASREYRRMESDLYNLVPEIGEVNQLRSNKPMAELAAQEGDELRSVGGVVATTAFSPRAGVKGDVARTYLYMDAAYPHVKLLSGKKAQLYWAWSLRDPVDTWECRRAYRIEGLQGNENPFVKAPCERAKLWPEVATYSDK